MKPLSTQDLIAFNKQGLIPGPGESDEAFHQRALFCLSLRQTLAQSSEVPEIFLQQGAEKPHLSAAFPLTKTLFDITPGWLPLIFSNEKLPPWHGGCAWIFQLDDDAPTAALLQLRQRFAHSQRYLGLYDKTEIIAHEIAHVGRMAFPESKFEEVLAYQTSSSSFRRWLGPVVETARESLFFILLLGLLLMVDIALIATGHHTAYFWMMWLKTIPLGLIGYGLWRVIRKQRRFQRCLKILKQLYGDRAHPVIYRLTDDEIILFSKSPADTIQAYVQEQQHRSLRWRLIASAYP